MSDLNKCREEFEKIDWVKERLKYVWWSQNNEYCDTGKHPRANASFLNGALHLFREHQAKVEELQKKLDEYILVSETLDQLYVKEVEKNKYLKQDFGKQRLDTFTLQNKIYGILNVLETAKKSKSDNYLIKEIESVLERGDNFP